MPEADRLAAASAAAAGGTAAARAEPRAAAPSTGARGARPGGTAAQPASQLGQLPGQVSAAAEAVQANHRRAAGTDVSPESQAVALPALPALPAPPAADSQQAAAQLAAETEDIARITTECAPGVLDREFSPQPLQQPPQEYHSSETPAEARKVWLGNIPGGVSLEC